MATSAVQNPSTESNSSRKKKAKAGSSANGSANIPAVPEMNGKDDSSLDAGANGDSEHPYIKELSKHIRNTHKKLTGMQKVDAIIAENPNTSLDDLVAQRKINPDQKAAALKKPQLQQQLAAYEEQVAQYRKIDGDYQVRLQKQKEELTVSHQKEIEKLKEELGEKGKISDVTELRSKLLVLSQFLRLAASKRNEVGAPETDEGRAFEGALLGVYGGGEEAVETALKLIDGSDDKVPSVEGDLTPVSYSDIRQASITHAPYESEASWVDSVAEANADSTEDHPTSTDPTIAHAGLTEMDAPTNGMAAAAAQETVTSPPQADAGDETGNAAGDRWDTAAAGTQAKGDDEGFEMVPRPSDEVDVPNPSALPADALLTERSGNSWADEPPVYDTAAASSLMRDSGDVKAAVAAGEAQVDSGWAGASEPTQPLSAGGWAEGSDAAAGAAAGQEDGDGFHQVPGRHRGRGGRGRGDGEFRGRGRGRGGFRGDGEFRGRGRGGFRGARGEGGEFRGRGGGRGRGGARGGAEGAVRAS